MTLHDVQERVAEAVQRRREQLGLSQTELARRMKQMNFAWHQMTVARTESSERPLRLDEAIAIAKILKIEIKELYVSPESEKVYRTRTLLEQLRSTERELFLVRKRRNSVSQRAASAEDEIAEAERTLDRTREVLRNSEYEVVRAVERLARIREMRHSFVAEIRVAEAQLDDLTARANRTLALLKGKSEEHTSTSAYFNDFLDHQREIVVSSYKRGATVPEIADRYALDPGSVEQILKQEDGTKAE